MLGAVRQNNALLEQIATASRSQAQAIGEVNTGVRQMDEMTQHNAALVEETNAAIEQTEAQASQLDQIVDVFRLRDTPVNALRPTAAGNTEANSQNARLKAASRSYLSQGNAAVSGDWSEF
jgi:methyl-accepting chemotaxis protein